MHEKLSFQIPAAVLSIKSRRLCDFAVCSALLEGQKVEIFKEEKKKNRQSVEFQDEPKQIQAKSLSCLKEELPNLQLGLFGVVFFYLVPDPMLIEPCTMKKKNDISSWCFSRCLLISQTTSCCCCV